ncbi:hypothetical protein Pla110_16810 [Polystyrenella longa]|uniref:DUF4328 domain-containing protein n=1 Tax=Polystyrenella longa TaxID=2528007 RepID=A0A518CL63_9PLAN|nr:hypothetical protein Pla110_16810 [Polystyrenella longa]
MSEILTTSEFSSDLQLLKRFLPLSRYTVPLFYSLILFQVALALLLILTASLLHLGRDRIQQDEGLWFLSLVIFNLNLFVILFVFAVYGLGILWVHRASSNLRSINSNSSRWFPYVATFCVTVPYLNIVTSFFYMTKLYRCSSVDPDLRESTWWRIPGAVFWRCLVVNFFMVSSLVINSLLARSEFDQRTIPAIIGIIGYSIVTLLVCSMSTLTLVNHISRMQQERYEALSRSGKPECLQCGGSVAMELPHCPVCGRSSDRGSLTRS